MNSIDPDGLAMLLEILLGIIGFLLLAWAIEIFLKWRSRRPVYWDALTIRKRNIEKSGAMHRIGGRK